MWTSPRVINKIMTSTPVSGYNSSQTFLPLWANERDVVWRGREMIEFNTLQTVTMRGIHLFWCQAGNLEAVRAFPAPTLALTGWEPGYRLIHQHMFLDTFQQPRQHIQITQSIPRMPRLNFRVLGRSMSWVRAARARFLFDIFHSFAHIFHHLSYLSPCFWSCILLRKMKFPFNRLCKNNHTLSVFKSILWFSKAKQIEVICHWQTASSALSCTSEYIQYNNLDVHGSKRKVSWSHSVALLFFVHSGSLPRFCLLSLSSEADR